MDPLESAQVGAVRSLPGHLRMALFRSRGGSTADRSTEMLAALSGVVAVCDGAVSDRDDANCPVGLGELVDDAVGADAQ
jgi:hypothetical protein